jgi:hypothetical protein
MKSIVLFHYLVNTNLTSCFFSQDGSKVIDTFSPPPPSVLQPLLLIQSLFLLQQQQQQN